MIFYIFYIYKKRGESGGKSEICIRGTNNEHHYRKFYFYFQISRGKQTHIFFINRSSQFEEFGRVIGINEIRKSGHPRVVQLV